MYEAMANFLYYIFIAPVWAFAGYIAGAIFPYEEDKRHIALAFTICALIYGTIVYFLFFFE